MSMKRIYIYTVLLISIVSTISCDNIYQQDKSTIQNDDAMHHIEAKIDTVSYLSLFNNGNPLLGVIDIKNCNHDSYASQPFIYKRYWDDNTYVGILDKYNVKFHNEYSIDSYQQNKTIQVRRRTSVQDENANAEPTISLDVLLRNDVLPITITRPYVEECAVVPYCYYDNMEIEWNPDPENTDGIGVLIRWTGLMIDEPSINSPLYHVCLVEDTGIATLDNQMFDGIPDGAYVTLFLVRANILQVQEEGEDLHIGEYDWNAIIENCPEIACQSTSIALGTAAKLSFVLVRNL